MRRISSFKKNIQNNTKVIENYFFMTAIQLINSSFGVLIYPYIIRELGAESYGLYVFALSVTSYFIGLISFGFSYPAIKKVIEHKNDQQARNEIISCIITAKLYLAFASTLAFALLLISIPTMRNNWGLFAACYFQIFGEVFSLFWYFQSIQKMKIVAYMQLGFKLISLPFIFIFIRNPSDSWIYALIISLSVVSGGFFSLMYLFFKNHFRFKFQSFCSLKLYFQEALPFFWSNSTEIIKQESVTIIIGTLLGMRDVALYDLANKIIIIPRILCASINSALFPKIIEHVKKDVIKRILRYETLIGLGVIAMVAIFGHWVVLILGGKPMLDSYPLAVILSVTVLVWLIVGSYISFVFVPTKNYYFVTQNQLVALLSFSLFCIPAVLIFHNVLAIISALTLSGICEIIYCKYLISRNKLL